MSASHPGICHICGTQGPLTFEHVPPRAAFNDHKVLLVEFEKAFNLLPDDPAPRGTIQQKGMGGYTLCPSCNNNTGGWYGEHFATWCRQAAELLMRSDYKPTILFPYYIRPLAVLKQIISMFFSVNSERFHEVHPDLVGFVLNRDRRNLTPEYRFFVYYNVVGRLRSQGVSVHMNFNKGEQNLLSEITFPPFGYVMTIDSPPPSKELIEITHFSRYSYEDIRMMQLKFPVLPTHLALPGDYRTKEEIYEQVRKSREQAAVGMDE